MSIIERYNGIREQGMDYFNRQRFLLLHFADDGLHMRLVSYSKDIHTIRHESSRFFKNVTEKNFQSNTMIRVALYTAFFPFSYNIIMTASHEHAFTKQYAIELSRLRAKDQITAGEIESYFSHHIPALIEKNKKATITKCETDDLNILLTQSVITNVFIDKKRQEKQDDLFDKAGARVRFDIMQTFISRPVFMALTRIIPRRAHIYAVYEDAVSLALALYQRALADDPKEVKPFLCIIVKETSTDVVAYDGTTISFIDTFNFGSQSLYETLNAHMSIDYSTFINMLHRLAEGSVSLKAKKYLETLLDQELARLRNGIISFKKSTGIKTICIDGGLLDFYLRTDKNFQRALISNEDVSSLSDVRTQLPFLSPKHTADIFMAITAPRKNNVQGLGIKYIRWLIPHHMTH